MSVIIVEGIPKNMNQPKFKTLVMQVLKNDFKILVFEQLDGKNEAIKQLRRCFIELPKECNADDAAKLITESNLSFSAFTPGNRPEDNHFKRDYVNGHSLILTHNEILQELRVKFLAIVHLDRNVDGKLVAALSEEISNRLSNIIVNDKLDNVTIPSLYKLYRKLHPPFADYEMVLGQLHKVEDSLGKPHTDMNEADMVSGLDNEAEDASFEKNELLYKKYVDKISKEIQDHLFKLDTEARSEDSEEVVARKKVRVELKKMDTYIPTMMEQIVSVYMKDRGRTKKVVMYADPDMPPISVLTHLLKKYGVTSKCVTVSASVPNKVSIFVPEDHIKELMELHGGLLNGSKVYLSTPPARKDIPGQVMIKMKSLFDE